MTEKLNVFGDRWSFHKIEFLIIFVRIFFLYFPKVIIICDEPLRLDESLTTLINYVFRRRFYLNH